MGKANFAACELWVLAGQGGVGTSSTHPIIHPALRAGRSLHTRVQVLSRLLAWGSVWVVSLLHGHKPIAAPAAAWTGYLPVLVSIHQAVNPGSRQGHGHADVWLPLLFWSGFNTDSSEKYSSLSLRPWRIPVWFSSVPSLRITFSINTHAASPECESNFYFPLRENRGQIKEIVFQ